MDNYLQKAYCMHQTVRIYSAITTEMVSYVQEQFNMWPTSLQALGRTLTIGAIMSCTYKNDDFINIKVMGDGPVGQIIIEGHDGKVRGCVENPGVFLQNNDGSVNVTMGVGNGEIEVVKDLHLRQPFSSSCEIIRGDIANDFTYYFAKSEQIPSSVGLGISLTKDSKVKAAGGFLIQVMPGCSDEDLTKLENKLKNLKPCTKMIDEGYSAEDIIREITDGDYELLETRELKYECNCSYERFERGLRTLGKDQLLDIIKNDHKCEITCNFCNKKYTFDENKLNNILNSLDK